MKCFLTLIFLGNARHKLKVQTDFCPSLAYERVPRGLLVGRENPLEETVLKNEAMAETD